MSSRQVSSLHKARRTSCGGLCAVLPRRRAALRQIALRACVLHISGVRRTTIRMHEMAFAAHLTQACAESGFVHAFWRVRSACNAAIRMHEAASAARRRAECTGSRFVHGFPHAPGCAMLQCSCIKRYLRRWKLRLSERLCPGGECPLLGKGLPTCECAWLAQRGYSPLGQAGRSIAGHRSPE